MAVTQALRDMPQDCTEDAIDEALRGGETAVDAALKFLAEPWGLTKPAQYYHAMTLISTCVVADMIARPEEYSNVSVSSELADEALAMVWEVSGPANLLRRGRGVMLDWAGEIRDDLANQQEALTDGQRRRIEKAVAGAEGVLNDVADTRRPEVRPLARVVVKHSGEGRDLRVEEVHLTYCWPAMVEMFQRAHYRARQAMCMSNLKQLALCMMMYTLDHDGQLPPADSWYEPLKTYAGEAAIFACPSDAKPVNGLSYFFNVNIAGADADGLRAPS